MDFSGEISFLPVGKKKDRAVADEMGHVACSLTRLRILRAVSFARVFDFGWVGADNPGQARISSCLVRSSRRRTYFNRSNACAHAVSFIITRQLSSLSSSVKLSMRATLSSVCSSWSGLLDSLVRAACSFSHPPRSGKAAGLTYVGSVRFGHCGV